MRGGELLIGMGKGWLVGEGRGGGGGGGDSPSSSADRPRALGLGLRPEARPRSSSSPPDPTCKRKCEKEMGGLRPPSTLVRIDRA